MSRSTNAASARPQLSVNCAASGPRGRGERRRADAPGSPCVRGTRARCGSSTCGGRRGVSGRARRGERARAAYSREPVAGPSVSRAEGVGRGTHRSRRLGAAAVRTCVEPRRATHRCGRTERRPGGRGSAEHTRTRGRAHAPGGRSRGRCVRSLQCLLGQRGAQPLLAHLRCQILRM